MPPGTDVIANYCEAPVNGGLRRQALLYACMYAYIRLSDGSACTAEGTDKKSVPFLYFFGDLILYTAGVFVTMKVVIFEG